jgi:hypothetical protein
MAENIQMTELYANLNMNTSYSTPCFHHLVKYKSNHPTLIADSNKELLPLKHRTIHQSTSILPDILLDMRFSHLIYALPLLNLAKAGFVDIRGITYCGPYQDPNGYEICAGIKLEAYI